MSLSWDTPVRFYPGNGQPGYRCTFKGCVAIFAGLDEDERFAAYAEFQEPVDLGGDFAYSEMDARQLEMAAQLLKSGAH